MSRPVSISSAALVILSISAAVPMEPQAARVPRQVDVIASNYAFLQLPARIQAGPTLFTFANQGKVQHELNLARLKPGVTMEDFVNAREDQPRRRELIDRSVGILIAGPGNTPDGRILVNLMRGVTYVVFCNLRDKLDAPGHLMFGMYTSFTPKVVGTLPLERIGELGTRLNFAVTTTTCPLKRIRK
ncbi:MAG TPA: hypothetical protein VK542_01190 [Gemmatimonadaceae bacterium]|nr:hypothetical protein [Gemmatimonadaceae bacterium]